MRWKKISEAENKHEYHVITSYHIIIFISEVLVQVSFQQCCKCSRRQCNK